jgi:DNA-binding IclR family transcriptional regulator
VFAASASAGGRAILSTMPDEDILEMYPSARLPQHPHSSVKLRSDLIERLEVARKLGYAVQRNESEAGVSAIAAPIRLGTHVASFSLVVALPTSRIDDESIRVIGAAVVRHASELAEALGL